MGGIEQPCKIQARDTRGQLNIAMEAIVKSTACHNGRACAAVKVQSPDSVQPQEFDMAKGQQRSNKETKKPKQPKKTSVPASSSVVPPARSAPAPGKNK
jgi:hypothetical protein